MPLRDWPRNIEPIEAFRQVRDIRGEDQRVIQSLEDTRLRGRLRTGLRDVPANATDIQTGDAVGDIVNDGTTLWWLLDVGGTPTWVQFAGGTSNAITALTGDVTASGPGSAGATLSNTGVAAGTYTSVTVDAKGRVIAGTAAAPAVEVTTTSYTLLPNTKHVVNTATLCTLTLPTTIPQFTFFRIMGKGAGGWKVAQNASQVMRMTSTSTTTGTGGSIASTNRYDNMQIECMTANTELSVTQRNGTLTVV